MITSNIQLGFLLTRGPGRFILPQAQNFRENG